GDFEGLGLAFPHPIRTVRGLGATPLANDLLAELALDGMAATAMGKDEVPDLRAISFSANDFIGHVFGPDSRAAGDAMGWLVRPVAHLLGALDQRVGAGRYTVVLTSDHGGAGLPEKAGGGPTQPVRMARDTDLAGQIEQAVTRAMGPGFQVA